MKPEPAGPYLPAFDRNKAEGDLWASVISKAVENMPPPPHTKLTPEEGQRSWSKAIERVALPKKVKE